MTDGGQSDTLGGHLRAGRRSLGLTIVEAADRLGVTPPALLAWERGSGRPSLNDTAKAAHVYGLDFAALLVAPGGEAVSA